MIGIINYLNTLLVEIGVEIRTTRDRVRLAELGAIRMYIMNELDKLYDEVEGELGE